MLDGLNRINPIHPAHHHPPDRHGRSAAPLITLVQPSESPAQNGREADMGFLQRVSLVSRAA